MTSLRNERALKISHTASDFGRSCGTALSEILKHSAVQFLFFIFIYIYIYIHILIIILIIDSNNTGNNHNDNNM